MKTREDLVDALEQARATFLKGVGQLPKWLRRAVARLVRDLARATTVADRTKGEAYEELAQLIDVELAPPPESRVTPSLPPDKEGDEELLIRRGRISRDSL